MCTGLQLRALSEFFSKCGLADEVCLLEVGSAPAGLALGQIESLGPWERGCGHAGRPGAGVSEVWVCDSHPGVGPSQELGFKGVCLKPGFMGADWETGATSGHGS